MLGYVRENRRKSSDSERGMIRDSYMVFRWTGTGHADMASGLAGYLVTEGTQRLGQLPAGEGS